MVVTEQWKPILKLSDYYEVSNFGRVRSWKKNTNSKGRRDFPRILKNSFATKIGYNIITIWDNERKRKTFLIHRLVAEMFVENTENYPQVNHIDGDKTNNRAGNLEWVSAIVNMRHAHKSGLMNPPKGNKHWRSIVRDADVLNIRKLHDTGEYRQKDLADMYGMSRPAITMIVNKKRWAHI